MGRFVPGNAPEIDRKIDEAIASIGREIDAMHVPCLDGVVLAGGYGRGEGGVREQGTEKRLSNDLDFFVIAKEGASDADAVAMAAALEPVSRRWTEQLGIDVDFTARTPWRIRHDVERLMIQELVRGFVDVAGRKGSELFASVERRPAEALPWMEAARLMMNRGMGLLFAKCKIENVECETGRQSAVESRMSVMERDFVNRNINKCILGAGDARLVAKGDYRWKALDRAAALGDSLYSAALEWKFHPTEKPVCDFERAREVWLEAMDEVARSSRPSGDSMTSRSLRNAARWLVRRRTVGDLRTFALNPVVRVLESVARHVRDRREPESALMRDWEIFN